MTTTRRADRRDKGMMPKLHGRPTWATMPASRRHADLPPKGLQPRPEKLKPNQ